MPKKGERMPDEVRAKISASWVNRPRKTCAADDCEKTAVSRGYCPTHYSRFRKHGHVNPTRRYDGPGERPCPVEGCDRKQQYNGMCQIHASRMARHGDPHVTIHPNDRNFPRGEASHSWAGDDVTYSGMHIRLRRLRGPASSHACSDCGGQAKQWSYDHNDPNEYIAPEGAYSTDSTHYKPRCVPCHKGHDLDVIARIRPEVSIDPDTVRRLREQRWGISRISRHLGVSRRRVERTLDELGLPRSTPGGAGRTLAQHERRAATETVR